MDISRRKLIVGIGALIAAPTIVRAASLMPVKSRLNRPLVSFDADGFTIDWSHGIECSYDDINWTPVAVRAVHSAAGAYHISFGHLPPVAGDVLTINMLPLPPGALG